MKYKLIKAIDVAGLNFLAPIVLLCYGEEPDKQIKKIGQFILVPLIVFALFLGFWYVISDQVQTKSGKLPNPSETWRSASDIAAFHQREGQKAEAYKLDGDRREAELAKVAAQLAKLEPIAKQVKKTVEQVREEAATKKQERIAPLVAKREALANSYEQAQERRKKALKAKAAELPTGSKEGKTAYLELVRVHNRQTTKEKEELKTLKAKESTLRAEKSPKVAQALRLQTKIAEEQQYLRKMADLLGPANRTEKIERQVAALKANQAKLVASSGEQAFAVGSKIVKAEERIKTALESEYAKPATLPYQIKRSVLCVFTGFALGSIIAIPIGILCGLSKTFMAAMTPFIALFKPVSPIVWLPVALIIVGGFIPDPDKHWLTQWLWDLPWLGQYKINPAFIASAITVALCSLWATMVNTAFGVASVDPDHMNVARVLRLGFWSRLFKIVLPSSLPLVFAGLRISLGVGWMVLIAAELLSSSEGIGKFVWDQFNNGASDSFAKMMVVVFVVGVIGLLLDRIMIVCQRLVSFDGAPTAL